MRQHRHIEAAYKLGRVIGFLWYPVMLLLVARGAWVAAEYVWRP